MKYHDQLKHPLWQKKRLEVLEQNRFQCENCGSSDETLHVHHPFYKRGAMVWDYEVDELQCLCNKCHKDAHAIDEEIKKRIASINIDKYELLGILKAMDDNPNIELNSCEEICGYLKYYGIRDSLSEFESIIIKNNGNPYLALANMGVETSFFDIGVVCQIKNKTASELISMGVEETISRIKTISKIISNKRSV